MNRDRKSMKVALCYNKKPKPPLVNNAWLEKYAEFDDEHTIEAIAKALKSLHEVILIEADEKAYIKFLHEKPEFVFNIAEGLNTPYREAYIPMILEFLKIPYTGSDPFTLMLCLNKALTKHWLIYNNIPTPDFQVFSSLESALSFTKKYRLNYPYIVKPLHEGSSIGVMNNSIVNSDASLLKQVKFILSKYKQPALVEKFLSGREFSVGLLGNEKVETLPIVEIIYENFPEGANPIYSYEAKWIWDTPEKPLKVLECPAEVDSKLQSKIEALCLKAYKALMCKDWARIDLRLNEYNEPQILEVNPLPGIMPNPEDHSAMTKAAFTAGLSYKELILSILNLAIERYKNS